MSLCFDCALEYSILFEELGIQATQKTFKKICQLSDPIVSYLKQEGHISGRALIILCPICTTELESKYLKSIPYEDLPLLINHTWYSKDAETLYKKLISKEVHNDIPYAKKR